MELKGITKASTPPLPDESDVEVLDTEEYDCFEAEEGVPIKTRKVDNESSSSGSDQRLCYNSIINSVNFNTLPRQCLLDS